MEIARRQRQDLRVEGADAALALGRAANVGTGGSGGRARK